jgi:glutamyl-tRNA synthetase
MRVEDLDLARVRPGAENAQLDDLRWLGLDWDEGPDVGGPHAPYRQSQRFASYEAAFERLRAAGRLYPCFCSRKDIAAAASAPQEPGDEIRYPGTCRDLEPEAARRRIESGAGHAWRFRVEALHAPAFEDAVHGPAGGPGSEPPGDFVVRRRDGTASYQLAVVVDDAAMRIDEVVRGDDLLASTARQQLLYAALDLVEPSFAHVPLLRGPDGERLSKRHRGTSLRDLRDHGWSGERATGWIAGHLGLGDGRPVRARDLVARFDLCRVVAARAGITIEPPV